MTVPTRTYECLRCLAWVSSATNAQMQSDGWVHYHLPPRPGVLALDVWLCGDCLAFGKTLRQIRALTELRPGRFGFSRYARRGRSVPPTG